MSQPRGNYGLTANCGKFYIVGGFSYNQNNPIVLRDTIDIFDSTTFARTTGQLYQPKYNVCAEAVGQNFLFAGGTIGSNLYTDLVEMYDCVSVGEEELAEQEQVRLYPNPARDQFFIETNEPGATYMITDMFGREILKGNLTGTRQAINIQNLPDGIYSIRLVLSNEKVVTKRILIAR